MKICVVGLGKLGYPMAALLAARGHDVSGVDVNERLVRAMNAGKPAGAEPGLAELMSVARKRLHASSKLDRAIHDSDAAFLVVPTPSESNGCFSMQHVLAAAQAVGQALRTRPGYFLVVLTSTVMPGGTRELAAVLEKTSGKSCPDEFGVCYCPAFAAPGSLLRELLQPELVLIGESDRRAGDLLGRIHENVHERRPPVAHMNYENAELARLALSTFVTTKMSYANMLAQLCERLEGGNVDAVTAALGLDPRIGGRGLHGTLGYGGPCLPRDSLALSALARRLGVTAALPRATDEINRVQVPRLAQLVQGCLPPGGLVGILGLAYQPHTPVVEGAPGVELARVLAGLGSSVVVHDSCALDNARILLCDQVEYAGSVAEVVRRADVLVLAQPCAEFKAIDARLLARPVQRVTIIDCWRLLERSNLAACCDYVALGTSDVARLAATPDAPADYAVLYGRLTAIPG